jgi:hypothetical protein
MEQTEKRDSLRKNVREFGTSLTNSNFSVSNSTNKEKSGRKMLKKAISDCGISEEKAVEIILEAFNEENGGKMKDEMSQDDEDLENFSTFWYRLSVAHRCKVQQLIHDHIKQLSTLCFSPNSVLASVMNFGPETENAIIEILTEGLGAKPSKNIMKALKMEFSHTRSSFPGIGIKRKSMGGDNSGFGHPSKRRKKTETVTTSSGNEKIVRSRNDLLWRYDLLQKAKQTAARTIDYVDDIMESYFDKQKVVFHDQLKNTHKSSDVYSWPRFFWLSCRTSSLCWIINIHNSLELFLETLWGALDILDRYMFYSDYCDIEPEKRPKMELVCCTALWIASKYWEQEPPPASDFVTISEHFFTSEEIINFEREFMLLLNFRITNVTPYHFVQRWITVVTDSKSEKMKTRIRNLTYYALELAIVDSNIIRFGKSPSIIAAASLAIAVTLVGETFTEELKSMCRVHTDVKPFYRLMKYIKQLVTNFDSQKDRQIRDKYRQVKYGQVSLLRISVSNGSK